MKHFLFRTKFWRLSFVVLVFLSGCGEIAIYQDLTEKDATEILNTLNEYKIEAKKNKEGSGQDVKWTVTVDSKDSDEARKILFENELPRQKPPSIDQLCGSEGIIRTLKEERCREIAGRTAQIVSQLLDVRGVLKASVILSPPEVQTSYSESQPDTRWKASVVLRAKKIPDNFELTEARIQRIVANGAPNIDPLDVTVNITYISFTPKPTQEPEKPVVAAPLTNGEKVIGLIVDPTSKKKLKIYALVFLLLLISLSVGLVLSLLKLTQLRQKNSSTQTNSGNEAALPPGNQSLQKK